MTLVSIGGHRRFRVAVLGATGAVGQRMVALLENHPWFSVSALCASERSAGKTYAEACTWTLDTPLPDYARQTVVSPCDPAIDCDIALSALDNEVAGDIEVQFASAGKAVVSNAKNHRMLPDVPLVIPEVNPEHLRLIHAQRQARGWTTGCIVTNPNCSTVGLVSALAPLHTLFGVQRVAVTTLQAISGAGYPGVASLDILDNVVPFIGGEEEKMRVESRKILGDYSDRLSQVEDAPILVSAQCNRVHVRDGHLECVNVQLGNGREKREDLIEAWKLYRPQIISMRLPSVPERFLEYRDEPNRPQPRRDRDAGKGMTVSIGRLRECPLLGWKFVVLSHNTVRGAAGAAIANAELLVSLGYVTR